MCLAIKRYQCRFSLVDRRHFWCLFPAKPSTKNCQTYRTRFLSNHPVGFQKNPLSKQTLPLPPSLLPEISVFSASVNLSDPGACFNQTFHHCRATTFGCRAQRASTIKVAGLLKIEDRLLADLNLVNGKSIQSHSKNPHGKHLSAERNPNKFPLLVSKMWKMSSTQIKQFGTKKHKKNIAS